MKTNRLGVLLFGCLMVALAACGDDTTAPPDASADASCVAGELDCECGEMNACDRGHCVAGICTLCTRGDASCLCRRDGTCGEDLMCRDALCASCPEGEVGCACEGSRCDEGAFCQEGVCVADDCRPGSADCPCRVRSMPACDDGLSCLGDGTCHACNGDAAGCPCLEDDRCGTGFACELGICQAPPRCADLRADGLCGVAERCEDGPDGAVCMRGECEAGFVFTDGECVEGTPNCEVGQPGSRLEECTSLSRRCVMEDDGMGETARCGECVGDTMEVMGVCQGPVPCGDSRCQSHQYCDGSGETPFCADLPCPAGEARGSTGTCIPCSFTCAGEGLSGRVFPFRSLTDACVCETLPGYYMPPGGTTTPEHCDADGDGWVRADVIKRLIQIDPALRQNARCDLIEVDGVLLRDEHGFAVEVASCEEGLFVAPDAATCGVRVPMPLVESRRNDLPGPVGGAGPGAPGAYGARRLQGEEVNDLTKYCVDDASDYNDDGTEDLNEAQAIGSTLGRADGRTRLRSFSHFVELHRAYAEPPLSGARYGKLVIEERYRCEPRDFALRYDPAVDPAMPTDGYLAGEDDVYWRSCQRGTDPAFDGAGTEPGFDFAQWSCPDGRCDAIPAGPPHRSSNLVTEPLTFGQPPPTGATLCELGARFPADGLWRGMNHHSQFKCVHAGGAGPAGVPLDGINDGSMVLNDCSAVACDGSDASCVGSRPVSPSASAMEPVLMCHALPVVSSAQVGFAAVSYRPYGTRFITVDGTNATYRGGCVNEDAEFADHLCPAPVFRTDSETESFGRNSCFVAPCPLGQADCDGNEFNGCEMEARDLMNCSGCGVPCALANATATCATGECKVLECDPSWGDCDGNPDNGCEQQLTSLAHCAACGRVCSGTGGAEVSCATGACVTISCPDGNGDCDGDNSCSTPLNTNEDCGGCGVACDPPNALTASCVSGSCEVISCQPGFGDCDGDPGNGCEVDLNTSLEHCGGCNTEALPTRCSLENATGQCDSGVCTLTSCHEGYADCDSFPGNGCEVQTDTSNEHCGACFDRCDPAHAVASCVSGECLIDRCNEARSDCDPETDGCETRHDTLRGSCGMGEDLGSMGGDVLCPNGFLGICIDNPGWDELAVRRGTDSAWFRVRVVEATTCSAAIEHRIRLNVPEGVNYDLHTQRACETGAARRSSTGGMGANEVLIERSGDTGGRDDSFSYNVWVEYKGGAACAEWELIVEGRGC